MTVHAPPDRAAPATPAPRRTPAREQSRARYPDVEGFVERDGVRVAYEVYGEGDPTMLLMPTWSIVHSRHWKTQIPDLARRYRVVTFDGRGNGRSDRPPEPERPSRAEFAADAHRGDGRDRTERRGWCPCRAVAEPVAAARGRAPGARAGLVVHLLRRSPLSATPSSQGDPGVRGAARRRRGLGQVEPSTTGVATTTTSSSSSSRKASRSRTRRSSSRTPSAGGSRRTRRCSIATRAARHGSRTRRACARVLPRSDCPMLVIHGTDDAVRPCAIRARLAELAIPVRSLVSRRRRPLPPRPRPGPVNLLHPRLRPPARSETR